MREIYVPIYMEALRWLTNQPELTTFEAIHAAHKYLSKAGATKVKRIPPTIVISMHDSLKTRKMTWLPPKEID